MADWIILDKTTGIGSDVVTITVSSYSELVERLKNLVFTTTDNKASDTCVVRQFGQSRYLLVEPSTVIAPYTGGEVEVRVIASEPWIVSSVPSWASCNATGGGAGTKTVRFTVQPNTGNERMWNVYFLATEGLEATLELKQTKYEEGAGIIPPFIDPDDCEGGSYTVTIKGGCWSFTDDIPSDCATTISVSKSLFTFPLSGGTKTFTVTANGNWRFSTCSSDGISLSPCSGASGTTMITLTAQSGTTTNLNINALCPKDGSIISTGLIKINRKEDEPSPICADALVWGTYDPATLNKETGYITINDNVYTPTVDSDNWALCSFDNSLIDLSRFLKTNTGANKSYASVNLSRLDTSNTIKMNEMFYGCSSLTSLDLSNINTSQVTTMHRIFQDCSSLTSLDLSGFNTEKVTNMSSMFFGCHNLVSLDLNNFNTSQVTTMYGMFSNCQSLTSLKVNNLNTSQVTDMSSMFVYCSSLTSLDLSNFDTSKVTDMSNILSYCSSLTTLDLSNFFIKDGVQHYNMFSGSDSLTTIKVLNCDSATKQKILAQLQTDLSSFTWTLGEDNIIRRS